MKDISEIYALRSRFKFLESIGEPIDRLKLIAEKDHPYFFNSLDQYQDNLLDDKENVLEPVKKFMSGSKRSIYENILLYLENNKANFDFINNESLDKLEKVAESPKPYKGNMIQEVKTVLEKIQNDVSILLQKEREIATEEVRLSKEKLSSFAEYSKLDIRKQEEVIAPFEKIINEIEQERFIGNIKTKTYYASTSIYQQQLELMMRLANPSKLE
ncbi:MAG: hypothetical protein IPG78_11555 [Ignavibacteria bacterium]|nr:hypothetical protein [Ignavibacteria bacterium]